MFYSIDCTLVELSFFKESENPTGIQFKSTESIRLKLTGLRSRKPLYVDDEVLLKMDDILKIRNTGKLRLLETDVHCKIHQEVISLIVSKTHV